MTTKTFILGKDSSLEDSILNMQNKLRNLGFNIVEQTWANPAPNIWWVHIQDDDCPSCFTNGKGTTKKAALASALGEYFERLSTNYFYADFFLGEKISNSQFVHYPNEKWFDINSSTIYDIFDDDLIKTYQLENINLKDLVDINSSNYQRGVCCIPFIRNSDNKQVFFPVNLMANLYVSNGMSAGNNKVEARVQALSEIIERWVKNKIIADCISLPEIPDNITNELPSIKEGIDKLKEYGYLVNIFDASLGGEFPVICVTIFNKDNYGCFASFGSHPKFEVALERTITELLQGREIDKLNDFQEPTFNNELVNDTHNLETHFIDSSGLISWDLFSQDNDFEFCSWNFSGTTQEEFYYLSNIFKNLNKDIYIADYNHLGINSCRIIVPDFSEIYPISEVYECNNNLGNNIRQNILSLAAHDIKDINYFQQIINHLDIINFDDSELIRQILGISVSTDINANDYIWLGLRLGELRCFLYLATNQLDDALDMAEWAVMFIGNNMNKSRQNFYKCLINTLEIKLSDDKELTNYKEIITQLYGEQIYSSVQKHITQDEGFFQLFDDNLNLNKFPAQKRLINSYNKLQKAKAKYAI